MRFQSYPDQDQFRFTTDESFLMNCFFMRSFNWLFEPGKVVFLAKSILVTTMPAIKRMMKKIKSFFDRVMDALIKTCAN